MGASVAVNGTCLTAVDVGGDEAQFDVIPETLTRTNLGTLGVGSAANFERSARLGDEIGGHQVSGHIQTTATVEEVDTSVEGKYRIRLAPRDSTWMRYILPKGFVAVDGVSLTVGDTSETWFDVYLIPETLRVTVMGQAAPGTVCNIEVEAQTQAIVDTVERVVSRYF